MAEEEEEQVPGNTRRLSDEENPSYNDETRPRMFGGSSGDDITTDIPDLVNPDWRSPRKSTRRRARRAPSASPQELQLWLQQGGWRYVALAAVLLLVALVALLSLNRSVPPQQRQASGPAAPPHDAGSAPGGAAVPPGSTLAPLPSVTAAPTDVPTMPPRIFVIVNTGSEGLFLRAEASSNSAVLETLPDGTRVEQIGDDVNDSAYTWRYVRTPSGQVGWVATAWLEPVP